MEEGGKEKGGMEEGGMEEGGMEEGGMEEGTTETRDKGEGRSLIAKEVLPFNADGVCTN